jgi:PKD repeat protein
MLLKREGRSRPGIKVVGSILLLVTILAMLGGCAWIQGWLNPNQAPVAVISTNPTSGEAPLEVTFDASESYDPDGDEISYEWDFDDGNITEGETVQHGFGSPGSYTVRLRVTDSKENSGTSSAIISVSQPPDESTEEQTFDAQAGTEYDSGTGLKVSVPPDPSGGQKKLVVTENPTPQQPVSEGITLLSAYDVAIIPEASPQRQGVTHASEPASSVELAFEVPPGEDSKSMMILEWTGSGWTLAENESGLPGGDISDTERSISVNRRHLSSFSLASVGQSILHALDSIPEPPPKSPEGKVLKKERDENGNWRVTYELFSPYYWQTAKLGGMYYRVDVECGGCVAVDKNGEYLPPGIRRNVVIEFPPEGGHAEIVLRKGFASLPRAAANWAARLGVDKDHIVSTFDLLVETYERYPEGALEFKDLVWLMKKVVIEGLWHLAGSKVQFFANVFPVSVDITTHILGSWDPGFCPVHEGLSCHDPSFGIDIEGEKFASTSTLYPLEDLVFPTTKAGKVQVREFEYDVSIKDYNYCFVATITPGGDVYGKEFIPSVINPDPSGRYAGQLEFVAPGPGKSQTFTIQGQMCPTADGQSNVDSETVSFEVVIAKPPDLTVRGVTLSKSSAQVGDTISVSFTVKNQGGSTPGQFTYGVFLATTKWGTTVLADEFSWPGMLPLNPGLSLEMEEEIVIPQVPDGDYYVTVYVDNEEQVAESDKNNNIGSTYPNRISISSGPVKALDSVTISGPSSVDENTIADYGCTAHFSDGSDTNVTSQASWSENTSYTTISSGRLNVGSLSSDKTCTVGANYTYNGATKSASKSVTLKNVPASKTLNSVTINGPSSVDENTIADYGCTAHFSDGSDTNVTSQASWSENTAYTTISSSGRLSVGDLSSDQTCTVTASYTYNGVTKSASKSVALRKTSHPDLIVDDIWTDPAPPIASDYTTIGIKVRNQGSRDATENFFLEFYFDGTYQGHVTIYGLPAGASKTSEWRAELWPSDTNLHSIRGVVDPDNAVTESEEANNQLSKQVRANQAPPSTGTLKVESVPGGAAVYIDGDYKGKTPASGYLTISDLVAGDHALKVTKSGYYDWTGTVTVPPGKTGYKAVILQSIENVDAEITSYNPPNAVQVRVGEQVTFNCTIRNTGNVRHTFPVGLSVWPVGNSPYDTPIVFSTKKYTLDPNEQRTVQWSHTFSSDEAGDWCYQFGVWKDYGGGTLLHRAPSPAKVITVVRGQAERLTNGSFSQGTSGWTLVGDFWAGTNLSNYRTSPGYAAGGVDSVGRPQNSAVGWMYQAVTIPSGATSATLSFYYNITSQETSSTGHDVLNVTIQDSAGHYLKAVKILSNRDQASLGTYRRVSADVTSYKGQTIRVNFLATTNDTNPTVFRIDDVSLMSDG